MATVKEIKKMNPQDQDFDWVKARAECSLSAEFVGLRCLVRKNIEIRNGLPDGQSFKERNKAALFEHEDLSEEKFCVRRHDVMGARVCFEIRDEHILVEFTSGKNFLERPPISLMATLNGEGECRFEIEGEEGYFLRWQVLHKTLEYLFFKS